jgi:hypothetical protein
VNSSGFVGPVVLFDIGFYCCGVNGHFFLFSSFNILLVPPWRNSFSCETLILDTDGNIKNMVLVVPGMQDNFPEKCLGLCQYH